MNRKGYLSISFDLGKHMFAGVSDVIEGDLDRHSISSQRRFNQGAAENWLRCDYALKVDLSFTDFTTSKDDRQDFCALLDLSSEFKMHNAPDQFSPFIFNIEIPRLRQSGNRQDNTMLVNVREISKVPHSSACGRATIWLIPFDDFHEVFRHSRQEVVDSPPVALSTSGHRKGDAALLSSRQLLFATWRDKRPSQVVKRTPKVMENLAESHTDVIAEGGGTGNTQCKSRPRTLVSRPDWFSIRIGFDINDDWVAVWVESSQQVAVEVGELSLCPIELVRDAIKRMHVLYPTQEQTYETGEAKN